MQPNCTNDNCKTHSLHPAHSDSGMCIRITHSWNIFFHYFISFCKYFLSITSFITQQILCGEPKFSSGLFSHFAYGKTENDGQAKLATILRFGTKFIYVFYHNKTTPNQPNRTHKKPAAASLGPLDQYSLHQVLRDRKRVS